VEELKARIAELEARIEAMKAEPNRLTILRLSAERDAAIKRAEEHCDCYQTHDEYCTRKEAHHE